MAGWAFLDHDGPIAFAHRGGALDFPENSMEAFEASVRLGYRYLETDVHLTSDGVVVAFHDPLLDRATDRDGAIRDLSWDDVGAARVNGVGTIPRLEDLLGSFPEARFNIDPKSDEVLEPLLSLLQPGGVDRVCIGSFSDARIQRARDRLGPELCTSMGPLAVVRLKAASFGVPMAPTAAACVQVPVSFRGAPIVNDRLIAESHRRGLAVHIWTVDDPAQMVRLLDQGVDGIMTDRPDVLRDTLELRGEWVAP